MSKRSRSSESSDQEDDDAEAVHAEHNNEYVLRNMPTSRTLFWDASQPRHLLASIPDKIGTGATRALSENEAITMALNEVAAQQGRGFFCHFRNRDGLKMPSRQVDAPSLAGEGESGPATQPVSTKVEPDFPALVYTNFIWDDHSRKEFLESSHRSRYLKSEGILNIPYDATPIYGIQYAVHGRYPLYATTTPSLVIIATPSSFYLASTPELESTIGRWPASKRPPTCYRPEMRLNTAPYLWPVKAKSRKTRRLNDTEREIKTALNRFAAIDVETLYSKIVERCKSREMKPNLTAKQLRDLVPQSDRPESGLSLGTPIVSSQLSNDVANTSANPPSRRGGRLTRIKKKH